MSAASFAFDRLAADYDSQFSHSTIGRYMRAAVARRLDARFAASDSILELNCGTGEDAVHLARRGVRVLATDVSAGMFDVARRKIDEARLGHLVAVRQLDLRHLDRLEAGPFDGALSNFGGLNCVDELQPVARALAARLRRGAVAILCVMGPLVPWEWGWYLARGQFAAAFRRLRRGGVTWRGMTIHYPAIGRLRRDFAPQFQFLRSSAVGALVPPTFAESWASRHPKLVSFLNRCERRCECLPPLPWLADHYVLELQRR